MEFKVGDRVELLEPAEGVGEEFANEIGVGTVKAIGNDASVKVELNGNFHSWWYKPEQLRHVSKPTPTPSITVGTQVRLTGVVDRVDADGVCLVSLENDSEDAHHWFIGQALEVIRQPFKRGEVVSGPNYAEYLVVRDEDEAGNVIVLALYCVLEQQPETKHHSDFERRP